MKTRKIILESKLKGLVNLTLPLVLNQLKQVQARAKVTVMRMNKWIRGGPTLEEASSKNTKR